MKTLFRIAGVVIIIIALLLFSPDINPTGVIGTGVALATLLCGFGLCLIAEPAAQILKR